MFNAPWLASPWPGFLPPLNPSVVIAGNPEAEIVSLSAMKDFLRKQDNTDDDRITSLIISARKHAELHTHRSLVKKSYTMSLGRFPNLYVDHSTKINLWYPPLTGDVSIQYVDSDGALQELVSGSDFQVDYAGEPGRVAPLAGSFWPATKYGVLNAVQIFYSAGYEPDSNQRPTADTDAADVHEPEIDAVDNPPSAPSSQVSTLTVDRTIPNDLVNAVMQLVTHWTQSRNPVITTAGAGGQHIVLPWHLEKILDDYTFDTLTPTITPEF